MFIRCCLQMIEKFFFGKLLVGQSLCEFTHLFVTIYSKRHCNSWMAGIKLEIWVIQEDSRLVSTFFGPILHCSLPPTLINFHQNPSTGLLTSIFLSEPHQKDQIINQKDQISFPPIHWNIGSVSSGVSLTSWGEGAFLALVGHRSSDGVTIKIPCVVDVLLHRPASHPILSY